MRAGGDDVHGEKFSNLFTRTEVVPVARADCEAMHTETRKRVVLEPELEFMAGHLAPAERRRLAASFRAQALVWARWARQLDVSAKALSVSPPQKSRLAFVCGPRLRLN